MGCRWGDKNQRKTKKNRLGGALLLGQAVRAQSPKAKKRTASPEKEPPKRTRCAKKNRGPGPKRTGRFFSAESAVVGRQWQGWAKRIETGPTVLVPPLDNKMRVFPCQSGTRALLNRHVHPKINGQYGSTDVVRKAPEKSTEEKNHPEKEPPSRFFSAVLLFGSFFRFFFFIFCAVC